MDGKVEVPLSLDPDDYDDIDINDPDNPEWSADDFARARPAREVLGDAFVDAWEKARKDGTLKARAVRDVVIGAEVAAFYEAQGDGWQARLNADLEDLVRIKRRR